MDVQAEVALKEWAVICAALRDGRHSLLLRKGGIREPGADRSFHVQHRSFALLPTYFHAHDAGRERDLVPELHAELAATVAPGPGGAPPGGLLRVELYAEVTGLWQVDEPARLHGLAGLHALSPACVADRFAYRRPGLWALLLRVHRLTRPVELPDRPGYAGCVSWVHLDAPVVGVGEPVLSDEQHARRSERLREVLGEEAGA